MLGKAVLTFAHTTGISVGIFLLLRHGLLEGTCSYHTIKREIRIVQLALLGFFDAYCDTHPTLAIDFSHVKQLFHW